MLYFKMNEKIILILNNKQNLNKISKLPMITNFQYAITIHLFVLHSFMTV